MASNMLAIKQKLARGEIATMASAQYASAALVEDLARFGLDAAFIDCEKGSATEADIESMCRGARAGGIAAIVRPWSADAGLISRYLDLGANGIMQAGVDDVPTAKGLAQAVQYSRWADWQNKLVIGMIESPQAIANLPQLLQVEGIDAWFVGPNDLAQRMNRPGQAKSPEVRAAVEHALRTISAAGRVAGTLAAPETLDEVLRAGTKLLLTRTTELIAAGARQYHERLAAAQAQVGSAATR